MKHKLNRVSVSVAAVGVVLCAMLSVPALAAKDADLEKKMQKLKELEAQKLKLEGRMKDRQDDGQLSGDKLAEVIARYEKLYSDCSGKKNERCADVMFNLAKFYYADGQDSYKQKVDQYSRDIAEWERTQSGPQPVNPIPNYDKALRMYRSLTVEYPSFARNDEAYYQVGHILLIAGEVDSSRKALERVAEKFPNSSRASSACFLLGDLANMDNDNVKALRYFEMVKPDMVTAEVREMTHYRKAELYYKQGALDKAAESFYTYVEKCDAGDYPKKQFRDIALSGMAVCFSEMPQGVSEAMRFFKKAGGRPFEPYVIYTIGSKNREHGQFDDAIVALRAALKAYPYYKDAPIAQHLLVECLVVKKQMEEANKEREKLIDYYQSGSEWYSKNSGERAIIDQADTYVKRALGNVAVYYHTLAAKSKDKGLYEKALKRYQEYFQRFSGDKWKVLEFKYNTAEVYNELQQFDKAVELYWAYAMEDVTKYPPFVADIDSLLFDDPKEYEEAVQKQKKKGALVVPQADAGYNAIVALDNARKKKTAKDGLTGEQVFSLPETQKLIDYVHQFATKFPNNPAVADLLYLAGNVNYEAKSYAKAIAEFEGVVTNFPKSPVADKAFRMMAKSYSGSGEFDLAVKKYRELLSRTDSKTAAYQEIVDLAALALYSKAEAAEKSGNLAGAVDMYKGIYTEFPTSKVADRGWFSAAECLQKSGSSELAAKTLASLPGQFPTSPLGEKALVRAADIYDTLKLSQKAGETFEQIFTRYPDEKRGSRALFNAGLAFEKGKIWDRAYRSYGALVEKYPNCEYAEESAFAVGICLDSAKAPADAARAFVDFARKFQNPPRQVDALVRAGDSYFTLGALTEAESSYVAATALYDKFKKKGDYDIGDVARAYCKLGEISQASFNQIALTGANEKAVKDKIDEKSKILGKALQHYSKSIELGISDWVIRSTYRIGESFYQMGQAEKNRQVFGSKAEKAAAQIQLLMKLENYYVKAQEKFVWNVKKAHELNLTGAYVDSSITMFMKMGYLHGHLFEEVAAAFASSPIPTDFAPEELTAYKELLEEKALAALDASVPHYENAIKAAIEFGIASGMWLDSVKARITENSPQSEWINKTITPWVADTTKRANQTPKESSRESSVSRKGSQSIEEPSSSSSKESDGDSSKKKKGKKKEK